MNFLRKLKHKLKMSFSSMTSRIKSGPLKDYKISSLSGSGFVRGNYEPEKTNAILNIVKPNDIALDVGAHIGYFSMLISKIVGSNGHVYSFDPDR